MRVRYGKPIKVKSLFGLQNNSTANISNTNRYFRMVIATNTFESGSGIYNNSLYKGASISNEDYLFLVVKTNIESSNFGACYFTQNTAVNYTNLTEYKIGNIIVIKQKLSTSSSDTDTYHFRLSQPTQVTYKVNYALLLNASEIGLDNLTAQEFYNKYNKYFSLIATGEEITIDDKAGQIAYKNLEEDSIRCKVAGGSSDIYYGYNQLLDGLSDNYRTDNLNYVFDSSTNKVTITVPASGVSNISRISLPMPKTVVGHKYLFFEHIKTGSTIPATKAVSTTYHDSTNTVTILDNIQPNTDYDVAVFMTGLTNYTNDLFRICYLQGTKYEGGTAEISWSNLIDLTDWFGSGKEPTTVAEFKEKFSKEYYGYCPTPIKLTRYQIEALPSYGYNQLFKVFQNFTAPAGTTKTLSSDNLSVTIIGNSTNGNNTMLTPQVSGQTFIEGHKYLGLVTLDGTVNMSNDGMSFRFGRGSENILRPFVANQLNTFNNDIKHIFFTYSSNNTMTGLYLYFSNGSNYNLTISNPILIDLTDWYGAGSEPTTIEEFKATFPNLYYPYSKKRLLNKYMINKLIN